MEARNRAVRARIRDWRLASDDRAGSWARSEAWRRELAFVRRRWRFLTTSVVVVAALIAGIALLIPPGFTRGLFVGGAGIGLLAALWTLVRDASGTGSTRMGGTAEQWTAQELRPLQRNGWRLINHYLLGGEIDHLLIGPAGVIVAETKWRRSPWRVDRRDYAFDQALIQVSQAARQVRLSAPVRRSGCRVRPVLFLWSAEASTADESPDVTFAGDVTVIRGRAGASTWRTRVVAAASQLSTSALDDLVEAVIEGLLVRDAHEAARQPPPPSVDRVLATAIGCAVAVPAAALFLLEPLSYGLYWVAVAAGVLGAVVGVLARRYSPARLVADAWLTTLVGVGLLAAIVIAAA